MSPCVLVGSGEARKNTWPTASGRSASSRNPRAQSSTSIQESGRAGPEKPTANPRRAIRKKSRFSRSPGPMIRGGRATATGSRSA